MRPTLLKAMKASSFMVRVSRLCTPFQVWNSPFVMAGGVVNSARQHDQNRGPLDTRILSVMCLSTKLSLNLLNPKPYLFCLFQILPASPVSCACSNNNPFISTPTKYLDESADDSTTSCLKLGLVFLCFQETSTCAPTPKGAPSYQLHEAIIRFSAQKKPLFPEIPRHGLKTVKTYQAPDSSFGRCPQDRRRQSRSRGGNDLVVVYVEIQHALL